MMHPTVDFKNFLKPGVRVHLSGIGGVSMCPLAEVLHGMGLCVQGSDMSDSDTVVRWASPLPWAIPQITCKMRSWSSARLPFTTITRRSPAR